MSSTPIAQVLADISGFIGKHPTPQRCIGAGQMLSKAEAETIINSSNKINLTDTEKEQYICGIAQMVSSGTIDDVVKKAAEDAYQNAHNVYMEFMQASFALFLFDQWYRTQFAYQMIPIVRVSLLLYFWSMDIGFECGDWGVKENIHDWHQTDLCQNTSKKHSSIKRDCSVRRE